MAHDFTESVANCAADAQPAFPLDASDAAVSLGIITDLTTCGGVDPAMSACVASAMSDALGGLPSLDDMLAGAGRMTTDVKRKYLEGVVVCKGLDPTVAHCIVTSLQPGLVDAALAPGPNPQQLIDRFAELKAACS